MKTAIFLLVVVVGIATAMPRGDKGHGEHGDRGDRKDREGPMADLWRCLHEFERPETQEERNSVALDCMKKVVDAAATVKRSFYDDDEQEMGSWKWDGEGERPEGGRPGGGKQGGRPRPHGERPNGERPNGERPNKEDWGQDARRGW